MTDPFPANLAVAARERKMPVISTEMLHEPKEGISPAARALRFSGFSLVLFAREAPPQRCRARKGL
jgi:hypothetical protein